MNYGFAFFPGQGAQAPGMGKDLYENSQAAKLVFEEASEGAGLDVAKLCFESDKATLSRTENSQIAIFTHSMAAWAALKEAGVEFKAAAGFSLGEYTALAAAGVVSLADGVKIVSMRGKLMQQAADSIDGGMAAILGLEDSVIEEACAKVTSGVVRPVNYNCRVSWLSQVKKAALAEAIENCKAAGARRALRLRYPVHSIPADGKGCRRAARLRCGLYLLRTEDGYYSTSTARFTTAPTCRHISSST
ncbi:MAG: ACP S-malonyltransferase [Butyricicoccus sp.]